MAADEDTKQYNIHDKINMPNMPASDPGFPFLDKLREDLLTVEARWEDEATRGNPSFIKVLSVDPGGTTGYCFVMINADVGTIVRVLEAGQLGLEKVRLLDSLASMADVIVIEDFILRNVTRLVGTHLEAVKVIGYLQIGYSNKKVVLQQPSERKAWNDQRLLDPEKIKGLSLVLGQKHAIDALRHAAVYARKNRTKKPKGKEK